MSIIANETKRRLDKGEVALGLGLRQTRTSDIGIIARACGMHWVFIDMEHGSYDVDGAAQLCGAALAAGVTPIVRVPGFEHYHASRLLDWGAQGIVAPHVSTVAEAKRIVESCKFPPIGKRSLAGLQPVAGFASMPVPDMLAGINRETLVVIMIETEEGLKNADAIAAVPGVDVLFIGAGDLGAELGIPGQPGHAKIEAAFKTVAAACKKHNKHAGLGGVYDPPLMQRYIKLGVPFVLVGSDLSFIMAGAKARAAELGNLKSA